MAVTNLAVLENRKRKKRRRIRKTILFLLMAAIIGMGIYYIYVDYSLESYDVTGNTTYMDSEIIEAVEKEDFVPNTLVMVAENVIFGQTYLPFIEKIDMSCEKSHVLHIKVKEKLRAGVFQYLDKYYYFNEQGIAMESRKTLFPGVPIVTGVNFKEVMPEEQIKVDGDYFDTIVDITKKISTYKLDISEIHFEGENDITLVSGNFRIYLGGKEYLNGKMSKIPAVLEALSEKHHEGTVDLSLYTDEKNIITYRK